MCSQSLAALLVLLFATISQAAFPICLVQNPGFANCDPTQSSATYSGFDVDLIRYVASIKNWSELVGFPPYDDNTTVFSRHFYFVCLTYRVAPLIANLTANNSMSTCAMGAGALTITAARWSAGVVFSYPFFRTGLGVMVSTQPQTVVYDAWAFLKPFHWSIWLALAINLACIPFVVWLVENLVRTGSIPFHRDSIDDIGYAIYTTFLTVFNLDIVRLLTLPAQIIIVCFCFMNLVMVATYTANLAAVLTTSVATSGYQAVSDLQGTSLAAHGPYVSRLATNENLNAMNITWNGTSTFTSVSEQIIGGSLSAYIFDYPILLYWKNFNDTSCQLTFLPEIEPFDYGIMFNKDFPFEIQQEFNVGILTAQSSAKLAQFENKYVSVSSLCTAANSNNALPGLRFYQVSGLWIILGCAVGIGILVSFYRIVKVHCFGGNILGGRFSDDGMDRSRTLSFTAGSFKLTHLADASVRPSRRIWRGESQQIDPETIGLDLQGSGPPHSSAEMDNATSSSQSPPGPSFAINVAAMTATAAVVNQKTISGPPGNQGRTSLMYDALRTSFAKVSTAAKDLAGKVLVDPTAPQPLRGTGDLSGSRSARRSSKFEAMAGKTSEAVSLGEIRVQTGNQSLSPFEPATEQEVPSSQVQTTAVMASRNRRTSTSSPLSPIRGPIVISSQLGGQTVTSNALNSADSLSMPLPPALQFAAPPQIRLPENAGTSLPHSNSSGRINDFYRPRAEDGGQRLLVNKALDRQLNDSYRPGSGSQRSQK